MSVAAAGAVKSVVAGKDAQLELRVKGAADGTAAQFEVFKAADDASVEALDGQVQKGKAVTTWAAVGPDETGTARAHRIYYVVTIDGVKTTSPELEVYHDTVEVTSQDADGAALADMKFRLTVKQGKRTKHTVDGSTGSTGTFVVTGLPVGDVSVEWRSPARLIEWVEETAKKRVAKLKKAFKAQLVYPKAGELHKQWVNLPAKKDQPDQGSKLKVRVKVHDDDGPSKKGDEVFLKLEYPDEGLSTREDPARGVKGGAIQGWSSPMLGVSKQVAADGGEVELEVELGKAGGDTVTIHVGGTEACEDEQVEVENWRKLYYHLIRPDSLVPHPFDETDAWLEAAHVVYERFKETTITREESEKKLEGVWQTGKALGREDESEHEKEMFILGDHNQDWLLKKFDGSKGKRSICLVLADALGDAGPPGKPHTLTVVKELSAAEEEVVVDASTRTVVLPRAVDDGKHPFISGTWSTVGAEKKRSGKLTKDAVVIEKGDWKVKVVLPKATANDPGNLVGGEVKVRVKLKLKVLNAGFGGRSWGQNQVVRNVKHASIFNHIITHELGHSMKQVVSEWFPPPKGLDATDHGYAYEDHGHVGPHCRWGYDDAGATHIKTVKPDGSIEYVDIVGAASVQPDYSMVVKPFGSDYIRAAGTCIMFGGIDKKMTTSPATDGICERCLPYFLAQDLESVVF